MTHLRRMRPWLIAALILPVLAAAVYAGTSFESYASVYDAEYTGAEACGACHPVIYDEWEVSPHANMTHKPAPGRVVGNFDDGKWFLLPRRVPHPWTICPRPGCTGRATTI